MDITSRKLLSKDTLKSLLIISYITMFFILFGMLKCSDSSEVIVTQSSSSQENIIPMYIAVELAHNPENVPDVVQMLGQMNISISKIGMPAQLTFRFFALNKDFDHVHNLYSFLSAHRILSQIGNQNDTNSEIVLIRLPGQPRLPNSNFLEAQQINVKSENNLISEPARVFFWRHSLKQDLNSLFIHLYGIEGIVFSYNLSNSASEVFFSEQCRNLFDNLALSQNDSTIETSPGLKRVVIAVDVE